MPKRCTICSHGSREAIEAAVDADEPSRTIAARFGVTPRAVEMHERHRGESRGKAQATKRKPGRRSKLTPERQRLICKALREGHFIETACQLGGIDKSTFFRWVEQGERQPSGEKSEFCDAVKKAMADAERKAVDQVHKAARDGTWQAAAWFLERRYPGRWGRRVTVSDTTERQLDQLQAKLRDMGGEQLLRAFEKAIKDVTEEQQRADARGRELELVK